MSERPLVLLTNDDGYQAAGLRALRDALRDWATVIVVAPESEQSATSHTLTLHRPLRVREVEPAIFALDGSPADCVYLGMVASERLLPRRPEMVVSGLNHGLNLGNDVFYSGTVGGAREGALRGVPALACSAAGEANRTAAAQLAASVAHRLWRAWHAEPGRRAPLLSLNIPPGEGPWPLVATTLGKRVYTDQVVFSRDPRGREYLWIGGAPQPHPGSIGTDTAAHDLGQASLTPLVLDLTHAADASLTHALVTGDDP